MGELDDMRERLQEMLGPLSGEPRALEGGITNHNFRARLGEHEYVVRRHGRDTELLGIHRGSERMASEAAARLGIAPAVAAVLPEGLVTAYVACSQPARGELARRAEEVAQALRAFHESGQELPARFWVPDLLERYERIVTERRGELPDAWRETASAARRIAAAVPLRPGAARPCHNDLLPGNLILAQDGGRMMIVDWEYAGMGHPLFDLGNLSVNNDFTREDDERLLEAYDGEAPTQSRRAALRLMRVLSDVREAAWGVVQGVISELDFDFARYAGVHFERLLAAVRGPEFEEWLATA